MYNIFGESIEAKLLIKKSVAEKVSVTKNIAKGRKL